MPWFARNAFTVRMRNARGWLATLLICGPSTGPRIFDMEPPRRARATVERRACDDEPHVQGDGTTSREATCTPEARLIPRDAPSCGVRRPAARLLRTRCRAAHPRRARADRPRRCGASGR